MCTAASGAAVAVPCGRVIMTAPGTVERTG
jgi:hypothetical protein